MEIIIVVGLTIFAFVINPIVGMLAIIAFILMYK